LLLVELGLGREPVPVQGPALELALGLVPAREQALEPVPGLASVHSQRQSVLIIVPQPRLDLKLVSSFSPPKY